VRFNKCSDPSTLRAFILHYVEKIVHLNGKVSLHGRVPVKYEQGDDIETHTLPFCIESEITREERYLDKCEPPRPCAISSQWRSCVSKARTCYDFDSRAFIAKVSFKSP
jgi:hypothetical protein